jgi:hypothetical protein
MLRRAAGNIMQSLERIIVQSEDDHMPASYAAYCAVLVFTGDPRLVRPLLIGDVCGPLDGEVVMRGAIRPVLAPDARQEMDIYLQMQAEREKTEPRLNGRSTVKYSVGTAFQHRMYRYNGLIRSWDVRYAMSMLMQ